MSVTLLVGNIGSGKSLLAGRLAARGHVIVNMDSIVSSIHGGRYGAYDHTLKPVYTGAEEASIVASITVGRNVVVDRTNMSVKDRAKYIDIAKRFKEEIICYDFGRGSTDGLKRRVSENKGISQEQWTEVFNAMAGRYEAPTSDEGIHVILEPPCRLTFHAFDFDGTIVKNEFPAIGEKIKRTTSLIDRLSGDLKQFIIIWTCRTGEYLANMEAWLRDNGVVYDAINHNPIFLPDSRKVFAHHYYDDRNTRV